MLVPEATIEGLQDIMKKNEELTGETDGSHGQKSAGDGDAPKSAPAEEKNHIVKSVNIEVSSGNIEKALDSLARVSDTSNFKDAMELVWFSFDPKKDSEMFGQMSLLTTLIRATLDGNIKPPIDLPALYQERCEALNQKQDNSIQQGTDVSMSPSPGRKQF